MKLEKLFKHPKLIIVLCIAITLVMSYFILDLEIDNSTRRFLPQKDASYSRLMDAEDVYGGMAVVGVSINSTRGTILTAENVQVIKNITDRVLELKDVDNMDSFTHIDFVCDTDGTISASQLMPETDGPITDADVEILKNRLSEWSEMYNRVIINDNNTATQMQISLKTLTDEELKELKIVDSARKEAVIKQIKSIVESEIKDHHLQYRIYGDDIITQNARAFMLSDLVVLIPLVILVVLISLFISFKTKDGTLLPLITVIMATLQTCGLMALMNIKFTIVSSVIPVALIAVGSAYGIHVLSHYYVALESQGEGITEEQYKQSIFDGLREVKGAVLLAGITTIIGFISLVSSPIEPLKSFSIFTAIGVAISLILSVTFIPSVLLLKSLSKVHKEKIKRDKLNDKIQKRLDQVSGAIVKNNKEQSSDTLYGIYHFFCGTRPRMIIFVVILVALSVFGLRKLNIETSLIGYFPDSCQMNQDIHYVDKEFAGTNSLHFIVTGPEKGSISNPELLNAVDEMQVMLANQYPEIGKIVSFNEMLKRINQVWHVPTEKNTDFVEDDMSFELDDFELDDFAIDDWGNFGLEDGDVSETSEVEWIDPNDSYSEKLANPVTAADVLEMLHNAYIQAGGAKATAQDMLKCLEQQYNYNGTAYYEIPYDITKYPVPTREDLKGVVDNYLTLLSGSLDRFLDDEMNPSQMKIQCQLRTHSTAITKNIINTAKRFAEENFPEGYTIEATGAGEIELRMTEMIVSSQLQSLVLSLLCVFVIITIAFKSPLAGIIGAVPLALTIILNYMIMGFAGINLDLVTSIIASVAVGVGIDYTIHFLTTYKAERAKTDNLVMVTKQTFLKSGKGIISNALAVGFGFLVLCFSKFIVLRYIGLLVALVMFTSSALSMTIIPGLLNLIKPKFIKRK